MTFSWIDILIVIIILVCSINGAVKGFVKGVLSLFTLIASVIIARLFSDEIGQWIATLTPIGDNIKDSLTLQLGSNTAGTSSVEAWLSSNNLHKIPDFVMEFLNSAWNSAAHFGGDYTDLFAERVTEVILSMIAFVVILVACFILFTILVEILDMVAKLPIIGTFNTLGGLMFGIVKGLMINIIIISVLFVTALYFGNENVAMALNSSILAQYFYIGYLLF